MVSNEDVIGGIIIGVDFGYGMKFNDSDELYCKLEIQEFTGFTCIQLFNMDSIKELFSQFESEVYQTVSLQTLLHRKVYLLNQRLNSTPVAITGINPNEDGSEWIYNNNWD